jgi:DNA-directed RNA polymerase subunit RPC12/RpoP
MEGYTHTCASCEARLKIHERYVGRVLHCTECGTEFLADPSLVDIDDIIEELVPETKRSVPWLPILVGVSVVIIGVSIFSETDPDSFFGKLFQPTRTAGQFASLGLEGRERIPAAMERETVVYVVDAIEDKDRGSLQALSAQGRIIEVSAGTKIKVIEILRKDRVARVRILEGEWTGRVLWVPIVALR